MDTALGPYDLYTPRAIWEWTSQAFHMVRERRSPSLSFYYGSVTNFLKYELVWVSSRSKWRLASCDTCDYSKIGGDPIQLLKELKLRTIIYAGVEPH